MNFTSIAFYILFICCILALYLQEKIEMNDGKLKVWTLIIFSLIFCAWQNWRFLVIVFFESIIVYFIALQFDKYRSKIWICFGVIIPLAFLCVFKYYNFFVDTFNFWGLSLKRIEMLLPIGVSFYTFSAIGYIIDIDRGKYKAEKSFSKVLLYMTFFPKLTAGPIISADTFWKQLDNKNNRVTWNRLNDGIQMILFGIMKKNVFSDHISEFVNCVYSNVNMYNAPTLLLAVFGYGIQIYLDFSGYSDMAIGCATCLGLDLPRNFNLPYLSRNISEFWKRWHITLSEWLMKYLYISLGGNRKGYIRTLINLLLTMAIGGLWHGSSWNFVLWGILNGLGLCVHKEFMRIRRISKNYIPNKINMFIDVIGTYIFVNFCWIFFRISDLHVIKELLYGIVSMKEGVVFYSSWTLLAFLAIIISTLFAVIKSYILASDKTTFYTNINGFYVKLNLCKFRNIVILFVVLGIILATAYADANPFIYAAF